MAGGEEVGEIWESQVVEGLVGKDQDFVADSVGEGEPVKVFKATLCNFVRDTLL